MQLGEGNLRSIDRGPLIVVSYILRFPITRSWWLIIIHGNELCIMVSISVKGWHVAHDSIVVSM
jgi:hypothetical protein